MDCDIVFIINMFVDIYVVEFKRHSHVLEITLTSCLFSHYMTSFQWRHNGRDSVSNHQPNDCLLNRLFRRRSKKTSKLRVTGLCAGKSPGTGEFPAQMASNAKNVSIWWRHYGIGPNCNHVMFQLHPLSSLMDMTCDCTYISTKRTGKLSKTLAWI